ncbi:hypothetical protein GCM10009839_29560 [Catenulispora yoronensis]|uniref:Uncharacterized protein n=1 Tax=Catenulispora yoronensis TaxID=450799 RepID=A0ABP5FNK2_9ACTN
MAKLLAPLKLSAGGGYRFSITDGPHPPADWIQATSPTDSAGEEVTVPVELVALVDEAAKTGDLDSLRKLCAKNCSGLATVLPAKDKSGRTGFQRLSELLEKAHPAGDEANPLNSWYFPGFTAPKHDATDLDQKDLKLFGAAKAASYQGLRTAFELVGDGPDGSLVWNGILPAAG